MSTRSCVAKPDGDAWKGRYIHFDGYPTAVGLTLWTSYHRDFGGDLAKMVAALVDSEDASYGWSIIAGQADLSAEPWWSDNYNEKPPGPKAYSRRGGEAPSDWIVPDPSDVFIEWVYVLTPMGVMVWQGCGTVSHGGVAWNVDPAEAARRFAEIEQDAGYRS